MTPSTDVAPLDAARFRALFSGTFDEASLDAIAPYYDDEVVFTDPIQTVRGREGFLAMNRRLLRRVRSVSFEVREVAQNGDALFAVWTMRFEPRPMGPPIVVEGVTHATLRDGRVWRHTDYWDLLGSMMDTVPLAGAVYRKLVARLG